MHEIVDINEWQSFQCWVKIVNFDRLLKKLIFKLKLDECDFLNSFYHSLSIIVESDPIVRLEFNQVYNMY